MKRALLSTVALFAVLTTNVVMAEGRTPPSPEKIKEMKTEMFKKIDTNSDGAISKEELAAAPVPKHADEQKAEKRREMAFEKIDANNDGSISLEEFLAVERPRKMQ
ncbi:hypothetical protein BegalDRAFT_2646 [Beggiatoa alba B18LD]|uniref:EF-hand domain-containing protein n=1 Tax=Beggiatoa alba B18LD TaxID=395493 RepID=I3CIP5_9GAMM|nr:EF-hand domain-containing protein [Beggiatoa alba]EIJ43488.1 hypothetical protein BegalDRAFT_2646 [Beggiatoa alba B18LD]